MADYFASSGPLFPENPTANHDSLKGFGRGYEWVNSVTGEDFVCISGAPGAASWKSIGRSLLSSALSPSDQAIALSNLGLELSDIGNVRSTTAWVLKRPNGLPATLDWNLGAGKFYYNGSLYLTEAAFLAAAGFAISGSARQTPVPFVDPSNTNLIPNGDFSNGTTGFTAFGGAALANVSGELQVTFDGVGLGGVSTALIPGLVGRAVKMSVTGRRGTATTPVYAGAGNVNAGNGGGIGLGTNLTPSGSNNTQTWFATSRRSDGFYAAAGQNPIQAGTIFIDNFLAYEAWPFQGWTHNAIGGLIEGVMPSAVPGAGTFQVPFQADTGSEYDRLRLQWGNDARLHLIVTCSGVQADLDLGTVAANAPFSVAFSAAQNAISASLNGGAPLTDTSLVLPGMAYARFGRSITGEPFTGLTRVAIL